MPKRLRKGFFFIVSQRGTRSLGHMGVIVLTLEIARFYCTSFRVRDYFDSSLEVFAGGAVPGKAVLCPGMEYCGLN